MKYIQSFIGGVLLMLVSCNEVELSGDAGGGVGAVTAGFRDSVITVFENAGTGSAEILFSQPVPENVTLVLTVAEEENMQENRDYFIPVMELAVAAGEKSAEVGFSVVDDNIANGARSFTLRMISAGGCVQDSAASCVRVDVLDDEGDVAVGFETTAVSVSERKIGGDGPSYVYNIPVMLSGTFRKPVKFEVAVHAVDGENAAVENVNFRLPENTIIVESADAGIYVPVEIIDDGEIRDDIVFEVEITGVTGGVIHTSNRRVMVTILGDKLASFGAESYSVKEGEELRIPVTLNKPLLEGDADPKVAVVVNGGSDGDFVLVADTLRFKPGELSGEVVIEAVDNRNLDANRILEVSIVKAGGIYIGSIGSCTVTIEDDESPAFEIGKVTVEEDCGDVELTVGLPIPLETDVRLELDITEGAGKYSLVTKELSIPAGETTGKVILNIGHEAEYGDTPQFTVFVRSANGIPYGENVCSADVTIEQCLYRKMLGEWVMRIGSYDGNGYQESDKEFDDYLFSEKEWNKSFTVTGSFIDGWGKITTTIEFDKESHNAAWKNDLPLYKNVGFGSGVDVYVRTAVQDDQYWSAFGMDMPLVLEEGKKLTWLFDVSKEYGLRSDFRLNGTTTDANNLGTWFIFKDIKLIKK